MTDDEPPFALAVLGTLRRDAPAWGATLGVWRADALAALFDEPAERIADALADLEAAGLAQRVGAGEMWAATR